MSKFLLTDEKEMGIVKWSTQISDGIRFAYKLVGFHRILDLMQGLISISPSIFLGSLTIFHAKYFLVAAGLSRCREVRVVDVRCR
jgi:hypothetical protein